MRELDVCPLAELGAGSMRLVHDGTRGIGVYNLAGELYALEDRCSHDDGPLCEGDFDAETGVVVCPRHGARFDIRTGEAIQLPATEPEPRYEVKVEDGQVLVATRPIDG